jgi:hypothetical protein
VASVTEKENEHVFTIGIKEEFQIIDPETRELYWPTQETVASWGRPVISSC